MLDDNRARMLGHPELYDVLGLLSDEACKLLLCEAG